ncbi:hypothetical protein GCM10007094_31870 [Pseudovibrio japonicus]|uniref:ABM domain-containing protein n=1 Tax=Pseudovibrio japonicus TaxID=366534 RepID=A0ABQ3EHM0_9HYPH|nr:antibiotic biosynthesis monooxygenase [Pseudovibrio japonicus]GHB40193.1 hypothetical protein GCM10007094_31870 [Pseudovibrio japonicus]
MKLVTIEAKFSEGNALQAREIFERQSLSVRQMKGCLTYKFYNGGAGSIGIIQKWETQDAFEAYRRSDTFAVLGKELKPLMTEPPITTIAEINGG